MTKSKIDSISIENFRVFKNKSEFFLAPITILTGANSSGKSSVIKALKLFQNFWNNLSEDGILDFSTGTHELGDYGNVLPYNSEKKEITISYKLKKHILFGELYIENVFKADDNHDIKNGKLKKSSLYQRNDESNTLLYEVKYQIDLYTQHETDIKEYYVNIDIILNSLIPRLSHIIKQRDLFFEKCPKPHKSCRQDIIPNNIYQESFGDYTGEALCIMTENYIHGEEESQEESIYLEPIVNIDLCNYIGIDFEIWKDMENHEGVSFLKGYPLKIDRKLFQKAKQLVCSEPYVSNRYYSRVLDLIGQIPIDKYKNFEEELWRLLLINYTDIGERINKEDFFNISSIVDDQVKDIVFEYTKPFEINFVLKNDSDWKILIQKYKGNDFLSVFQKFEKEEIEKISHPSNTDKIINFNFQDKKSPSLEGIIFHSILFYSTFLDRKIFDSAHENISTWDLESKIPLLSDIREEMERVSYTLLKVISSNMSFVDAMRANMQRFYTFSPQGTSFNHILLKYLRQSRNIAEKRFIEKWIKEFEIGDEVFFSTVSTVGANIFIKKDGREVNLIDLGYGVTPFLALILNILSSINEKLSVSKKNIDSKDLNYSFKLIENTIVIEEPEVSLHPKLQSKLADFLWDAHEVFNVNFIIETHSEYLIRKFQYLTAKGCIGVDDIILHYIDNPDKEKRTDKEIQVRTINIKSNGDLSSPFGKGFLDEADNLAMKLWSFS